MSTSIPALLSINVITLINNSTCGKTAKSWTIIRRRKNSETARRLVPRSPPPPPWQCLGKVWCHEVQLHVYQGCGLDLSYSSPTIQGETFDSCFIEFVHWDMFSSSNSWNKGTLIITVYVSANAKWLFEFLKSLVSNFIHISNINSFIWSHDISL